MQPAIMLLLVQLLFLRLGWGFQGLKYDLFIFFNRFLIHILVYAKNSRQQLILSNIQQDGFTIYYYYFIQKLIKEKRLYDR